MSYYYKYNFVSPEPIFAEVKEELRSYFDTGVVDDILFPRYVEDCLKRLGRSSYKIVNNILKLENYKAKLPDDFEAVRELWVCSSVDQKYRLPGAYYEQVTSRITPIQDRCDPRDTCLPDVIRVTYKTNNTAIQSFNIHHLLKPGTVQMRESLSQDCLNRNLEICDEIDSFDIRDGKIVTNIQEGTLYLVYYVKEYDANDYQMIPDNIRIKDYLKAYLKARCFENIYNNTTDETFRQVESKFMLYTKMADEAKVMAETEIKKQTIHQVIHSIKSQRNRFKRYHIS